MSGVVMKDAAVNDVAMNELGALATAPWELDFHQALRRLACAAPHLPRPGEAWTPRAEPVRLGQEPSLAFAPSAVRAFEPPREGRTGRLRVAFFGLFGPQGPLPSHFTELAQRARKAGEPPAISAFADLFHHRLLLLLHRAWSAGRPEVCEDRPHESRFAEKVALLSGVRDALAAGLPRSAGLQFAGHFACKARSPERLASLASSYFECPATIREFVPEWLTLPSSERWQLGKCGLGRSTCAGARVLQRAQRFELELGPLRREQYRNLLPGAPGLARLQALVRSYVGPELAWDVKLTLAPNERSELRLGQLARLGYDSWLGSSRRSRPASFVVRAEARAGGGSGA